MRKQGAVKVVYVATSAYLGPKFMLPVRIYDRTYVHA